MSMQTAMQSRHAEAGAQLIEIEGVAVPESFGDVPGEYDALRQSAALLDLSFQAVFTLRGADAVKFLNNMVTNDVAVLRAGTGCHALKVSLQGKMEAALRVLRVEDGFWCDVHPAPRVALVDALRKRILISDVQLEDASANWTLLSVHGPEARDVVAAAGAEMGRLETLHAHAEATLAASPARIVRSDHSGDGGYDVFVPRDAAGAAWDALRAAGARPVGFAALDLRRIECGIPSSGREITPDRLPQEAGLEDGWLNHTKGCYLGQETIARLHHLGHVNRHLRGLRIEGDTIPPERSALRVKDQDVGIITSARFSPRLGCVVALAYVRSKHAEPGTSLDIVTESRAQRAEVVNLPMR